MKKERTVEVLEKNCHGVAVSQSRRTIVVSAKGYSPGVNQSATQQASRLKKKRRKVRGFLAGVPKREAKKDRKIQKMLGLQRLRSRDLRSSTIGSGEDIFDCSRKLPGSFEAGKRR
ncbi:MAG: hypothetical protein HYT27_00850 [Parcubacteria group bacterium]|nr:hypothetical protein [Parcubacteria group bacterium]